MRPMIDAAHSWHRGLRHCDEGVDDLTFLQLGVHRILRNNESGRDFFQYAGDALDLQVGKSAFFDLFHSKARLELLKNTTVGLYRDGCHNIETDLLGSFAQLEGLDVIAGDGHLLAAACHSQRDYKNRKVAPNSLFMLNVRNGLMLPLASVQGDGRYAHEMPVLREHLPGFLKQTISTKKRLKNVLLLLDPAFNDTVFWTNLNQARKFGALVILPQKDNLSVYGYRSLDFDRDDPINAGILSFDLVGFAAHHSTTMHRIVYRDPETKHTYRFLTTATDLSPGLVAMLYLLRWRIEKAFDVFKNKLHERKAWGNGPVCQQMQAHFACMAHNLILLLSETLKEGFGIEPLKLYQKREKALERREMTAKRNGGFVNPLIKLIKIPSQISCQLIRCLRNGIASCRRFYEHLPDFRRVMECYL